jgi:hypothetical protein
MSEIQKLVDNIKNAGKAHVKVNTAWATVKSVNWSKKTMVATGVADDLDYFDVLLGLGSVYRKPKNNTLVLIGIIENKEAAAFLIDAEEVEEIVFNGGYNNGLVNVEVNKTALNQLQSNINALKAAVATAFGTYGADPSLATAATTVTSAVLTPINILQIEDTKFKH